MKYPIDTENCINVLRQEFDLTKAAEDTYRVMILVLNAAYDDGMHSKDGYPLELDIELKEFSAASGILLERVKANLLLPALIEWMNAAYAQGQQNAKEAIL